MLAITPLGTKQVKLATAKRSYINNHVTRIFGQIDPVEIFLLSLIDSALVHNSFALTL